jgi:hypothetical protein
MTSEESRSITTPHSWGWSDGSVSRSPCVGPVSILQIADLTPSNRKHIALCGYDLSAHNSKIIQQRERLYILSLEKFNLSGLDTFHSI